MLGLLAFLHQRLAVALLVFALILGIWGTASYLRSRQVGGGYRSSYLIMAGLTGVQGLAGVAAYLAGGQPREALHIVYGLFAIGFLPGLYAYARSGSASPAREAALLAAACWIVLIAFARGITTGR